MKPSEASKKLEFHSKQICHGCVHPSMVGWCENAGKKGKETEIHHSGRVFRIREVAQ